MPDPNAFLDVGHDAEALDQKLKNTKNPGGMFGAFWDNPDHWIYIGIVGFSLLGWAATHRGHSKKIDVTDGPTTPAQAAASLRVVDQQVSKAGKVLKTAGYSNQAIVQAQNQVMLDYGTRIMLASTPSKAADKTKSLYVTGADAPNHYASLMTVDAHAYVGSLSASPTAIDITENSAAVHGLTAGSEK